MLCGCPLQPKKVKNMSRDVFGSKLGRVHMKRQDFRQLQTRKMKGLKRTQPHRATADEGRPPTQPHRATVDEGRPPSTKKVKVDSN